MKSDHRCVELAGDRGARSIIDAPQQTAPDKVIPQVNGDRRSVLVAQAVGQRIGERLGRVDGDCQWVVTQLLETLAVDKDAHSAAERALRDGDEMVPAVPVVVVQHIDRLCPAGREPGEHVVHGIDRQHLP
jgi:hypothetical protein